MFAHCINVGQADATLLEFQCGAVLIDAGAQDEDAANHLLDYLRGFFQKRADLSNTFAAIYITHPHKDHTFALKRVLQTFHTRNFVDNGQDYGSGIANVRWVRSVATQRHISIKTVLNSEVLHDSRGTGLSDDAIDPLKCAKCDPEIVILSGQWDENPGWSKDEYKNNNNHSLVIRVGFGDASFLFPGDLEEDGIASLLDHYSQTSNGVLSFDVDVYHVGHHGSHNATTQAWMDALTPTIAVISVGAWNDGRGTQNPFTTWAYGHPRRVTVDLLGRNMAGTRAEPIQVRLGTAGRRFYPLIVKKRIYATAWDGDTLVRATLGGQFRVTATRN